MNAKSLRLGLTAVLLPAMSAWTQYSSPEAIHAAIGPVESLSPELRRAFTPNDDFKPLPKPGENDWLAIHPEPGQTYRQFVRAKPNKAAPPREVIYLQPLDSFTERDPKSLLTLRAFTRHFFRLPVTMQRPVDVSRVGIAERKNPFTEQRQLLTPDILDYLRRDIPPDGYCRLAITNIDLYPEPAWNFVFGQASLSEGTGVFSFARYDPSFYGERPDAALARLRSFKVLAHETGHMFGIEHCVYLLCLMNGSNTMEETDASPIHLCPVCLRKLQHSVGFDIAQRYRTLATFYRQAGLVEESAWVTERAAYVSGP